MLRLIVLPLKERIANYMKIFVIGKRNLVIHVNKIKNMIEYSEIIRINNFFSKYYH